MPSASPYYIEGPALISFSGGRTSGFMLKKILEAHGGALPEDVHVAFANTGREMPETLDFVQECSERWSVKITWLEFDSEAEHRTRIVSHNSASRNGEPFDAVIQKSRSGMLPNPVVRFCTIEMKIRRFDKLMHKMLGYERWNSVIGLRADELHRVERQRNRNELGRDRWHTLMPCAEAGATKRDVSAFWHQQPFDLQLLNVNGSTPDGNCDLCFLKGMVTIQSTMRRRPETAEWWINQEMNATRRGKMLKPEMALFRADRPSYAAMFDASQRQGDLLTELEGGSVDCACTD